MAQFRFRTLILLLLIFVSPTSAPAQQQDTGASSKNVAEAVEASDIGSAPDQKALDNLQKYLVGSRWTGTFTVRDSGDKLHTEEYEIVSAEREQSGDEWMLVAKIKYMKKDVKVPVGLLIKWVDRTPVIVLDQVTIPGMGTFDSRVIIRKGMYAGTWAHGKVGGHLFGKITTAADAAAEKAKAESTNNEKK